MLFQFSALFQLSLCPDFVLIAVSQIAAENIPPFALPDDSVVEVQGEPTGVHKAVELIASHLRKFLVDRSVISIFEIQVSFALYSYFHVLLWRMRFLKRVAHINEKVAVELDFYN